VPLRLKNPPVINSPRSLPDGAAAGGGAGRGERAAHQLEHIHACIHARTATVVLVLTVSLRGSISVGVFGHCKLAGLAAGVAGERGLVVDQSAHSTRPFSRHLACRKWFFLQTDCGLCRGGQVVKGECWGL
jgi:hypothetical protein